MRFITWPLEHAALIWDALLYVLMGLIASQVANELGHPWWVGLDFFTIAYYLVERMRSHITSNRKITREGWEWPDGTRVDKFYD